MKLGPQNEAGGGHLSGAGRTVTFLPQLAPQICTTYCIVFNKIDLSYMVSIRLFVTLCPHFLTQTWPLPLRRTRISRKRRAFQPLELFSPPKIVSPFFSRRRRGTWERLPMATWCSKCYCRMWGGLGPRILIIPALLSLSPMRGAAIGSAPTILHNDLFYTKIYKFVGH